MQHLAVRSGRQPPAWAKDKYVMMLEMQCGVCKSVSYQLWSPILETEKSAVDDQMRWVARYIEDACIRGAGAHADWFLTPDRPDSV
jgi:hypothetical protein